MFSAYYARKREIYDHFTFLVSVPTYLLVSDSEKAIRYLCKVNNWNRNSLCVRCDRWWDLEQEANTTVTTSWYVAQA